MSGVVLVVGLVMAAAGAYEMFAGYGDILSERGWSAFIAGSVLLAGGVVTMALGMVVRAVDRLHASIFMDRLPAGAAAASAERIEPGEPAAAPAPVSTPVAQADLFHEPTFEQAPTAPVTAAAPIEHALAHEQYPTVAAPPPPPIEPEFDRAPVEPAQAELQHEDWLDHSFAELEREMTLRHEPVAATPPTHSEPVAAVVEPMLLAEPEPPAHPVDEPAPATMVQEKPEVVAHDHAAPAPTEVAAHPAHSEATVSAREAPAPSSAVIGRYESEGTSYVMYADGSIDAQSEAGVYRFSSMAELKSFIES